MFLDQEQDRCGHHQQYHRDDGEDESGKDVDAVRGVQLYVFVLGFLPFFGGDEDELWQGGVSIILLLE